MNNSELLAAAQKAADTAQAAAGRAQEAAQDATYKLAELKESMAVKAWPQRGDIYFYSAGGLHIYRNRWDGDPVDMARMAKGNVYREREEAEQAETVLVATTKVLARIKELNAEAGWVCDFDRDEAKHRFIYNHTTGKIGVSYDCKYRAVEDKYYFIECVGALLIAELTPEILLMLGAEK